MEKQTRFDLPGDPTPRFVRLPSSWLGQLIQPDSVSSAIDPRALVARALDHPIGSPRLEEIAKPGQKVALVVDDMTRHTPARLALPLLIERLGWAGVTARDICIVVALGTHRMMNEAELVNKLGREVIGRYRIVQSNWAAEDEMVYLGQSENGIPAWVNQEVAGADLHIALGMITPHMDAGFSGGAKMILPGVCGKQTVDAFHIRSAYEPGNVLGDPLASLRLTLEQFVQEHRLLDFILDLVLTPADEVYGCVAGHPVDAHRQGVRLAQQVYGASTPEPYPVTVANCAPYQQDLWQSCKGLWCGDLLTADGGTLIWVTSAPEGTLNYPHLPDYIGSPPDKLRRQFETGPIIDPLSAATGLMIGRMKQRVRIVLVSEGLKPEDAARMDLPYYPSVEPAVADAVNYLPPAERARSVAVIPQAGIVLPIFEVDRIC